MWLSGLRAQQVSVRLHRPAAAAAPIQPLAQELPYATDVALKKKKNNGAEDLNRHSSKEAIEMVTRQRRRCSVLLVLRDLQIKTEMRCHLTPREWPSLKSLHVSGVLIVAQQYEPN